MSKVEPSHMAQTTTPAKTRHYVAVLSAALLRGAWGDSVVGKDYKGRDMDWGELLRKWEKHGGNDPDVIHHLREISLLYLSHPSPSASGYITIPQPYGTSTASDATDGSGRTGTSGGTGVSAAGTATSDGSFVHVHHPGSSHASVPPSPSRSAAVLTTPVRAAAQAQRDHAGTSTVQTSTTATHRQTPGTTGTATAPPTVPPTPAQSAKERASYLRPANLDLDADTSDTSDEQDTEDAWRLGTQWWRGIPTAHAEEVQDGIRGLEALVIKGKLGKEGKDAAVLCWAYHLHAAGQFEAALRLFEEVDWSRDSGEGMYGEGGRVDRVRGRCLQAMSIELVDPTDPLALEYYLSCISSALPLLSLGTPPYLQPLTTSTPNTAPQSRRGTISSTHTRVPTSSSTVSAASPLSSSPPTPAFEPMREVHRWLSTALCRAAVLSARSSGPGSLQQTLRILRTYHLVSASYPPNFKPKERRRMLRLYAAALREGQPGEWEKAAVPYLLPGIPGPDAQTSTTGRSVWRAEVVTILRQGRDLLSTTTTFPRSGSRNVAVQAFVEDAVGLALLADDPSSAADTTTLSPTIQAQSVVQEVVDTLYWAQTITFNSQPILRHLATLLSKQGEWEEARRAFEAYRRLVRKEREAEGPEAAVMDPDTENNATIQELDEEAEEGDGHATRDREVRNEAAAREGSTKQLKMESDEMYAQTLLLGARIVGRELGEVQEALELVKEAMELHGADRAATDTTPSKAGKGLSRGMQAQIHRLHGVLQGRLAVQGTMPLSQRQALFTSAIDHLARSASLCSSSLTSYQLAHLYAITGELDKATEAIRACLESEDSSDSMDDPNRTNAEASEADSIQNAPEGVAAWHLLALLRSADRDWDGALRACEAGIGAWEEGEDVWDGKERVLVETLDGSANGQGVEAGPSRKGSLAPSIAMSAATSPSNAGGRAGGSGDRVASKDFGVTSSFSTLALNDQSATPHAMLERRPSLASVQDKDLSSLIDDDGHLVSSTSAARTSGNSSALAAAQSPYHTRRERLQDVIALRQTAIVIREKRDGAEVALVQQKELFGFFKSRSVPSAYAGAGAGAGGSRRQRSGTSGTMGTIGTTGTIGASGISTGSALVDANGRGKSNSLASTGTGQPQGDLGLVGAAPGTADEGLRGMTPLSAGEGEKVEVLHEKKQDGEPSQGEVERVPASGPAVSTKTDMDHPDTGETAANAATAALDTKPLAPILLGPPIGTSTPDFSTNTAARSAQQGDLNKQINTVDLTDDNGPIHVSPLSTPSGLPNSTSATEAISATAHGAHSSSATFQSPETISTSNSTSLSAAAPGLTAPGRATHLPIPLITESGASTPLTHESSSGPGTRTTNSPPGSVRFGHVDFAGAGLPSPTKGKSHTLGFGKLHVPLMKHHAGKQRAGTLQGGLGVGQTRGLESPSAPDLTATRSNRITSQSSIALSTTSNAGSMFKRLRHPYATSTYAQSTTSKRRLAGRGKRQGGSGAASMMSGVGGSGTPSTAADHGSRRQSTPLSSPPPPTSRLNDSRYKGRTPAELRVLSDLWLASAATYRRLGETGQARGAIQEAEAYDSEDPAVWVQLALCELAEAEEMIEMQQESGTLDLTHQEREKEAQRTSGRFDRAIATLNKALALQADHLPALMHLAKMYLVKAVSQSQAQLFAPQPGVDSGSNAAVSAGPTSTSQNPQQQSQSQSHTRQAAEGDVALCEALLNGAIEGVAWSCTEAYAMRAECRRLRGDEVGEREDLIRALEGEVGRGIRGWDVVRDWI